MPDFLVQFGVSGDDRNWKYEAWTVFGIVDRLGNSILESWIVDVSAQAIDDDESKGIPFLVLSAAC